MSNAETTLLKEVVSRLGKIEAALDVPATRMPEFVRMPTVMRMLDCESDSAARRVLKELGVKQVMHGRWRYNDIVRATMRHGLTPRVRNISKAAEISTPKTTEDACTQ